MTAPRTTSEPRIETVVCDLAGTTVVDDGLVEEAFTRAWDRRQSSAPAARRDEAIAWVQATMGQSKIEVFRHLLVEEEAQDLNRAFEAAYDELVAEGRSQAIEGAEAAIRHLLAEGRKVAFTTGFARRTADGILASLGWTVLADAALTPADAGRGRPHPDLNLLALLRTRASSVAALAVVGDTESDMAAGVAAGAGLIVGVLTGARHREDLLAAGADQVLGSIAELPALLERLER